jgi:hypothetical protein
MSIIRADQWQRSNGTNLGTVLQTKYVHKTNSWSGAPAGDTYLEIPGMSISITPFSLTSWFLINVTLFCSTSASGYHEKFRIVRNGSTPNALLGDAEGGRPRATGMINIYNAGNSDGQYNVGFLGGTWVDTPATTSPLTYRIDAAAYNGNTFYLNRSTAWQNQPTLGYDAMPVSSMIIMEIAQ